MRAECLRDRLGAAGDDVVHHHAARAELRQRMADRAPGIPGPSSTTLPAPRAEVSRQARTKPAMSVLCREGAGRERSRC